MSRAGGLALGALGLVALFAMGGAAFWLTLAPGETAPQEAPMLADVTQTRVNLLERELHEHPFTVTGTSVNVADSIKAQVYLYHADAVNNLGPGPTYFLQGSQQTTGDVWENIQIIETLAGFGDDPGEINSEVEPPGSTIIEVAVGGTTGFEEGNWLYFGDAQDHEGEWHLIQDVVANTHIELVDGLTYQKEPTGGKAMVSEEEMVVVEPLWVNTTGYQRLRMVVHNEGTTGPDVAFFAPMVIYSDFE